MSKEKENKIIADIILAKTELKVLKLDYGLASTAMAVSISAQYAAQVNVIRQNGAAFVDILMMLTEEQNEKR